MSGGSVRLDRGRMSFWLATGLGALVLVVAGPLGVSDLRAQQTAPAIQDAPAPSNQDTVARIEEITSNLHTMTAGEVQARLAEILRSDLTDVPARTQISALNSLGAAHERLAQEIRSNRNDPAAERKSQEEIDSAVAAYVRAGRIALEAREYGSAEQVYNRALAYRPNLPEALLGVARVYAGMGNKPLQAIERYQEYLRGTQAVYEPGLYVEMGKVYAGANLWHQALKAYRQAATSGVDTPELASALADCYMALNRPQEALEEAKKAISRSRGEPTYHSKYAQMLISQRAFAEACQQARSGVEAARELLKTTSDTESVLRMLHDCCATYVRALEVMLALDPNDLDSRLSLVKTLQEQADAAQLLATHLALTVAKSAPQSASNKALLEEQIRLMEIVRHTDLESTCRQLLQVDPSSSIASGALARLGAASAPAPANP